MVVLFPRNVDRKFFDETLVDGTSLRGASDMGARGWTTWTFTDWLAGMPLSNLQDNDIAVVARSTALARGKLWFNLNQSGLTSTAAAVAIVNHNLPKGAKWRVVHGSTTPPTEALPPTGIDGAATSNYTTPATTEVDEEVDDTTDTTGHTVTSAGTATTVRYTFATPSPTCTQGTDLQEFRVRAGLTAAGSQTMTVKLYESGSLVSSLGTATITATSANGGEAHSFYWDAASLSTTTGANAELQVEITGSLGVSGTVMAAVWYADGIGTVYEDSGWLNVYPNNYEPSEYGLPTVAMYEFSSAADLSNGSLTIQLWGDAGANDESATWLSNGYFDLGRALVGRDILPSTYTFADTGIRLGEKTALKDDSEVVRTRDGQSRAIQRARYIEQDVAFPGMTRSEKNQLLADMAAIGHGGEVCLLSDTDVDIGFYENIYGRFEDWDAIPAATDVWEVSFKLCQNVSDDGS